MAGKEIPFSSNHSRFDKRAGFKPLLICIHLIFLVIAQVGITWASAGTGVTLDTRRIAVPFVENTGQADPMVAYYASTFAGEVFVTHQGDVVLSARVGTDLSGMRRVAVRERFLSDRAIAPSGRDEAPSHTHYFSGPNPSDWQTSIPSYDWVSLGEVAEGISVSLRAYGDNVEKYFYIAPGADVDSIGVGIEGITSLTVSDSGQLVLSTGEGDLTYSAPVAWQTIGGTRVPVTVSYLVDENQSQYGFVLGRYDPRHEVVIDPLIAATYLGGADHDYLVDIEVDGSSVYVGGLTFSSDFPTTMGAYDETPDGVGAGLATVSRLTADLTTLEASTFVGMGLSSGTLGGEKYVDIEVHGGHVYLAYRTFSASNPVISGSYDATYNGSADAFVARLSTDLSALTGSSYLGGTGSDSPYDLEVDAMTGNVCLGGETNSTNFPTTSGAHNTSINGGVDGFVACLNADLSGLAKSTYLGTTSFDLVSAIYPFAGSFLAVGRTNNPAAFPTPNGAFQIPQGGFEGYIALFNASTQLASATLFGSAGSDHIKDVVLNSGSVYIVGHTNNGTGLPISGGADTSYNGGSDIFVARFSGLLSALQSSTFYGGNQDEYALGMAVDSNGAVYVLGWSESLNIPTSSDAFVSSILGPNNLILSQYPASLDSILHSTYLRATVNPGVSTPNDVTAEFDVSTPQVVYLAVNNMNSYVTAGAAQGGPNQLYDGWVAHYRIDGSTTQFAVLTPAPVDEDAGPATVSVIRTGSTQGLSAVLFDTDPGSAQFGSDYLTTVGHLIWQPGEIAPKQVSIGIVDDDVAENTEQFTARIHLPAGGVIQSGQDQKPVTIIDDDVAGVFVRPVAGPQLVITEAPDQAHISVSLTSEPAVSPILIRASSDDTSEGVLTGADANGMVQLAFDNTNWDVSQLITVESVNDAIDDGDIPFHLNFAQIGSPDPFYDGLTPQSAALVTLDDDTAGIQFASAMSPLVTSESGTSDSFTARLASEPLNSVTLNLMPDADGQDEGMLSQSELMFSPGNWDSPQTVSVTGLDDLVIDGDVQYEILYSSNSLDSLYDFGITGGGPVVVNQDDDALSVDVTVIVDDNQTQMLPFIPTTYRVDVVNRSSTVLNDVGVISTSNRLDVGSITWTCQSVDMSTCDQASGTGHLMTTVDLDADGAVFFEVLASAINQPFEQAIFTAEALVPFGTSDSNPSDNLDLDSNLIFVSIIFEDSFEN